MEPNTKTVNTNEGEFELRINSESGSYVPIYRNGNVWMGGVERSLAREIVKKMNEHSTLQQENQQLRELLSEAKIQIEYMHEHMGETGSGNNVISRIEAALQNTKG